MSTNLGQRRAAVDGDGGVDGAPVGLDAAVLTGDGAEVEMRFDDRDAVTLLIRSDPDGPGARRGARLVCQAVSRARARHTHRVRATLTASQPSCGIVLDALRTRVGRDVDAMTLRRAGSTVLVTVDLVPLDGDGVPVDRGPRALSGTGTAG